MNVFSSELMKKYSGSNAHRLGKTLILYLPFVIILGGYFYWRFIVFPQVSQVGTGFSNTPFLFYDLLSNPPGTLISLLTTIIADLRFTFLSSWSLAIGFVPDQQGSVVIHSSWCRGNRYVLPFLRREGGEYCQVEIKRVF